MILPIARKRLIFMMNGRSAGLMKAAHIEWVNSVFEVEIRDKLMVGFGAFSIGVKQDKFALIIGGRAV